MVPHTTAYIVASAIVLVLVMYLMRRRTMKRLVQLDQPIPPIPSQEPRVDFPDMPTMTRNKHHIVLNSVKNTFRYDLPEVLKNVVHVELVSAIIPKSMYRVNKYNNKLSINNRPIQLMTGYYFNVLALLLELNHEVREVFDETPPCVFVFDTVKRKVIIAGQTGTVVDMTGDGSMSHVLGFSKSTYMLGEAVYPALEDEYITTSIAILNDTVRNSEYLNNKPTSSFQTIEFDPSWEFQYGEDRVNMNQQLYVDIEVDEIRYWDGSHRLARVHLPEDKDLANFSCHGRPLYRNLRDKASTISHLTFTLKAVVTDEVSHQYELNGMPYSLQVELVTLDT